MNNKPNYKANWYILVSSSSFSSLCCEQKFPHSRVSRVLLLLLWVLCISTVRRDLQLKMADSTADATTENAVTLRRELKKLLTENFYDGGGSKDRGESDDEIFGVLKTIDEAIRVLTFLREVESKNPESDIPSSSKVEVPKEFKCPISNDIMIQPVVIASGQVWFHLSLLVILPKFLSISWDSLSILLV